MESLQFTITEFNHKFAVLYNSKYNLKINWPIKELSHDIEVGHTINLSQVFPEPKNQDKNETELKKLLEELIN